MSIGETSTSESARDFMLKIISNQPEDATYDDLLREVFFGRMIMRGLSDSDAGRTHTQDEVKQRIDDWFK